MKLERRFGPKPWGRTQLPPMFGDTRGERIGEVWFLGPDNLPLMAKYIFTDERLSIQNHPDDAQAHARGLPRGKEECWYILDAEPGASLALGFVREVSRNEIRASATDRSIVDLLDWKPVAPGDFFYVPAGTVHAIGAGISLLEFQQSSDVTYRLYDYGRPRELHLADGAAVARTSPYADPRSRKVDPSESAMLVDGPKFSLAHIVQGDDLYCQFFGRRRWLLPLDAPVVAAGCQAIEGECLLLDPNDEIDAIGGRAFLGMEGSVKP